MRGDRLYAPRNGVAPMPPEWLNGLPRWLPARLGRYELTRLLGQGGMGAVYLATDAQLGRLVALKLPRLDGPGSDTVAERFTREARLASTLNHPNLCPVYDSGTIDGVAFLAMAYLEGKPLAQILRGANRLPPRAVAAVVRQLALAMSEAHARNVLHRDLKPSNVMITPDKRPVVMDFGLARRFDDEASKLTASGTILGTPAYMSPEQINCDANLIGPGCDIYALGVIFYECLTGHTPFEGPLGAVMAQAMTRTPAAPSRQRDDLDPSLDAIALRALEKKPYDRYPTMKAFAEALGEWLRSQTKTSAGHPALPAVPAGRPAVARHSAPAETHVGEDAATLFNQMAQFHVRAAGAAVPTTGPRRRRGHFKAKHHWVPAWLIPVVAAAVAVAIILGGGNLVRKTWADRQAAETARVEAARQDEEREKARLADPQALVAALPDKDPKVLAFWKGASEERLAALPSAVAAAYGKHLVAEGESFSKAVHLLARSDDPRWRQAAEYDLTVTRETSAPIWQLRDCADFWYNLGMSLEGRERHGVLRRADHWYGRVERWPVRPETKRDVEQRRAEIARLLSGG